MTSQLMCTCGKHHEQLNEMFEKNQRWFNLTRELLKEQAEEIFTKLEEIDMENVNHAKEWDKVKRKYAHTKMER